PAALRSRRGRGGGRRNLGSCGAQESVHDGDLGHRNRGASGGRLDPLLCRACDRDAGARPRHLAPVPPRRRARNLKRKAARFLRKRAAFHRKSYFFIKSEVGFPLFFASRSMTCLCSQIFIEAESFISPV